jgi:exodeoxyribonuclease VIII
MRHAVRAHPAAAKLLTGGAAEVSLFANDERGAYCKARYDYLTETAIVDLKTTEDASPAGFARSLANYKYNLQAAHYRAMAKAVGLGDLRFVFVAVEKSAPHAVACYELDAADLILAENERQALLALHSTCSDFKTWPAYSREVETITLPNWAKVKAA